MNVNYDQTAPYNQGVDFNGIPAPMVGKPAKGADTGKWDEIILPPDAVANGAFLSNRAVRVTSQGFATPCTLGQFVKVTTNGNYVVKCKLDAVPQTVKAIRAEMSAAQKAEWKANGPQARQARAVVVPVVPGQGPVPMAATGNQAPQARQATQAPQGPADILKGMSADDVKALAALLKVATAPQAPQAPSVPTVPQGATVKAPRGKTSK